MNGFKLFTGLALLVAVAHALTENEEWEAYKAKYGKTYESNEEEATRKAIYYDNKKLVTEHNQKYSNGEVSFTVTLNHLADMTAAEVKQKYNGYRRTSSKSGNRTVFTSTGLSVADSIDWREMGVVTPVKNQEDCGGCWAFSSTGSIEGQHALATGNLVSLSEQNLIDCSTSYGNEGCDGGLMDEAFEYVIGNGGIDTEASYPFVTTEGQEESCTYNPYSVGATLSSFADVDSGDVDALKEAVGSVGPVSIAIDASLWSFQLYDGGIYADSSCGSSTEDLDHGVLAVGYGSEDGTDYWLVKNSWGTSWGEEGYIKILRSSENLCGVATEASYPIV